MALTLGLAVTALLGWGLGLGVEAAVGPRQAFLDAPLAEEAAEAQSPGLTGFAKGVTWLGNRGVVIAAMAVISTVLWLCLKKPAAAMFLAASVLGGYSASHVVKDLVNRVRPVDGLVHASGGSFPSGHAVASVTLYAGLALIVWRVAGGNRTGRGRPAPVAVQARGTGRGRPGPLAALAWIMAVPLIIAIGASRVYLGVHWASDVLGGILLGAVWLTICGSAWSRWERLHG